MYPSIGTTWASFKRSLADGKTGYHENRGIDTGVHENRGSDTVDQKNMGSVTGDNESRGGDTGDDENKGSDTGGDENRCSEKSLRLHESCEQSQSHIQGPLFYLVSSSPESLTLFSIFLNSLMNRDLDPLIIL